jgi:hypothetical protein
MPGDPMSEIRPYRIAHVRRAPQPAGRDVGNGVPADRVRELAEH